MTFLRKVAITVAITFLGKVAVAVAITKKNVANRTLAFLYYTNFLDSLDTILDRTKQIQFTFLPKKTLDTIFCGTCV